MYVLIYLSKSYAVYSMVFEEKICEEGVVILKSVSSFSAQRCNNSQSKILILKLVLANFFGFSA